MKEKRELTIQGWIGDRPIYNWAIEIINMGYPNTGLVKYMRKLKEDLLYADPNTDPEFLEKLWLEHNPTPEQVDMLRQKVKRKAKAKAEYQKKMLGGELGGENDFDPWNFKLPAWTEQYENVPQNEKPKENEEDIPF